MAGVIVVGAATQTGHLHLRVRLATGVAPGRDEACPSNARCQSEFCDQRATAVWQEAS